jgi:sugar phosphate isomerase/epimerase
MAEQNSIRIGNQTAFSAGSVMEPFQYALANGFEAFEWFPDKKPGGAGWDELDLSAAARSEIRGAGKSRPIRLSVHARWTMNPLSAGAAELMDREIGLAEDLGASILIVHLYTEAGIRAYAEALLPMLRSAAAKRIQIAVENTVATSPAQFNELFAALRDLDASLQPHVGMCLDVGHANLCAATRNNYLAFIDQLDPDLPIIHLHVHENWGDADSHLALFTGPAAHNDAGVRGFVQRLKQRGFSGSLILEQWPQPPSLLNQARDALRRIWLETPIQLPPGQLENAVSNGSSHAAAGSPNHEEKP